MIKVGQLLGNLTGGGAERVVLEILKHLDRNIFQPVLILYEKKGEYLDQLPNDIEVIEIGNHTGFLEAYKYNSLLKDVVTNNKLNILHTHLTHINTKVLRANLISDLRIPIIISEHNNFKRRFDNKGTVNKILYKKYINKLYRQASKIICCSNGVVSSLKITVGLEGYDNFRTIYNPVDIKKIKEYARIKSKFIDPVNINNSQKTIIAVGSLTKQKGFDILLKSIAKLKKEVDLKLLIVGGGVEENNLKSLAKKLDLETSVVFTGFLKNPWAEIANSDLFVLSSRWEGFGNVIIEAMGAGTPVLSTNCNFGPSEIILSGKNGYLVEPEDESALADAILYLIRNPKIMSEYVEEGFKTVKRFESKSIITNYEDLYKSL